MSKKHLAAIVPDETPDVGLFAVPATLTSGGWQTACDGPVGL